MTHSYDIPQNFTDLQNLLSNTLLERTQNCYSKTYTGYLASNCSFLACTANIQWCLCNTL